MYAIYDTKTSKTLIKTLSNDAASVRRKVAELNKTEPNRYLEAVANIKPTQKAGWLK